MWFQTEVLSSRILQSLFWHLVLQSVCVQAFVFIHQTVSWYPLLGIQTWLSRLFTGTSLLYHFFLNLMCIFFACLHAQNYSVHQHIPVTRLQAVWNVLHPQRIIHLVLMCFSGSLVIFCYTQLLGGEISNLQSHCDNNDCSTSEVNGHHLFVLVYGVYAGAIFSVKYFRDGGYLVRFPVIQQLKFVSVKSSIRELMINSILQVLKNLHWYYVLYFIFGSYPKYWLSIILDIQDSSRGMFNEVFNLNLLVVTVGCGTSLYFTWTLYSYLFDIFVTESYEFSIKATQDQDREKGLPEVLKHSRFDTLKYLAFLDLRALSQNSPSRRSEIFSISQPGGHPYIWAEMASVCLSSLEDFLDKLNALSTVVVANASKFQSVQTPIGTPIATPLSRVVASSTPIKTPIGTPLSRATASLATPNIASVAPADRAQFQPDVISGSASDSEYFGIPKYLITSLKKIQEAIRKKPLVAYFLNELPDAKARKLFSTCQPIIWTIEALSFLVSASYKEDKYGVVQKSFPRILCLLIDLKLSEEKLQLGTISVKRHGKESSSYQKETLFRHSLKSALNSSIYRIIITFNKHINGVRVPDEYQRHIKRYMDFKE